VARMPRPTRRPTPAERDERVNLPDVDDDATFEAVVKALLDVPAEPHATSTDADGSDGDSR